MSLSAIGTSFSKLLTSSTVNTVKKKPIVDESRTASLLYSNVDTMDDIMTCYFPLYCDEASDIDRVAMVLPPLELLDETIG